MGFAPSCSYWSQMGAPKRQVIAIIGDGGYQMTIQELEPSSNNVWMKIVSSTNEFLGMVRNGSNCFLTSGMLLQK